MAPVLLLTVFLALAQTPPASDQARLEACLNAIPVDAETAYEDALAWRHQGGGWPAEHCVSLALIALGQEAPGRLRLREAALGAEMASDLSRAIMLGQSGEAFLTAEEYEQARISFEHALEFAPRDPGLLLGFGRTQLALEDYAGADISASAALAQEAFAEAYVLRAEARLLGATLTPRLRISKPHALLILKTLIFWFCAVGSSRRVASNRDFSGAIPACMLLSRHQTGGSHAANDEHSGPGGSLFQGGAEGRSRARALAQGPAPDEGGQGSRPAAGTTDPVLGQSGARKVKFAPSTFPCFGLPPIFTMMQVMRGLRSC